MAQVDEIRAMLEEALGELDRLARLELERVGQGLLRWLQELWPRMPCDTWLDEFNRIVANLAHDQVFIEEESRQAFIAWLENANQAAKSRGPQPSGPAPRLPTPELGQPYAVCFAAGTLVLTRRGQVAIESVTADDEVWAVPESDPLAAARWCRVERTYHNAPAELVIVRLEGGEMIHATLNHPIFVRNKSFIAAQHLCPGDLLRTADDHWVAVAETFCNGDVKPVYNLCVPDCHTYFAGGVLVHNDSPEKASPKTEITAGSPFESKYDDYLTANVLIIAGKLRVQIVPGSGNEGTPILGIVDGSADPDDTDSAQVIVKWTKDNAGKVPVADGVRTNARPQAETREVAADWKEAQIGGKDGVFWDTPIPSDAVHVDVVLVYTDTLVSVNRLRDNKNPVTQRWGDFPAIIGSWSGDLINGQWGFTINRGDITKPNLDAKGRKVPPTDTQLATGVAASQRVVATRTGGTLVPRDYGNDKNGRPKRRDDTGFDVVPPK